MTEIAALSLWQPWASLLVWGEKKIETRHWPPHLKKGQLLLIHAAKRWQEDQWDICLEEPFQSVLKAHGIDPRIHTLPRGVALGVVKFEGYWRTEDLSPRLSAQERAFGNYAPGRFGWYLTPVQEFDLPVVMKGQQGLFKVKLR